MATPFNSYSFCDSIICKSEGNVSENVHGFILSNFCDFLHLFENRSRRDGVDQNLWLAWKIGFSGLLYV